MLHLTRFPADLMTTAMHCANSTVVASNSQQLHLDEHDWSSRLTNWLDGLSVGKLQLGEHDFRHLNAKLDRDDVRLLCEANGHAEMFQLMQHGADPFGVWPTSARCQALSSFSHPLYIIVIIIFPCLMRLGRFAFLT
jgi:hypothetical protein